MMDKNEAMNMQIAEPKANLKNISQASSKTLSGGSKNDELNVKFVVEFKIHIIFDTESISVWKSFEAADQCFLCPDIILLYIFTIIKPN